jgi:6-phosphogluconolactonase/glucosamine-6-phosphate isomerase/deaminase
MHYTQTDDPISAAAQHLAASLLAHLDADERVLLLLSGGSGIAIALALSHQLAGHDLHSLVITLTDERYGKVGHEHENWQQLLNAGFSAPGAKLYRPLKQHDRATTTKKFDVWLKAQMSLADYRVGIFGLGSDGHTAGIKPHSNAVSAGGYVTAFDGEDYERITITFQAINQLDEAVIQASGTDKVAVIKQLFHSKAGFNDFPAAFLRKVPVSTLYTNQQEEV